ncbi:MAG: LCP family protein, partial [Clostridia bacterium]|nr:LCP family protein [Clostridia bacterium]
MKKKERRKVVVFIAVLILIVASFIIAVAIVEQNLKNRDADRFSYSSSTDGAIYIGEQVYIPNRNLETLLIMGTDTSEEREQSGRKYTQSDFDALVVLDKAKRSFTIIHTNRDTMTEINLLNDETNKKIGTQYAQITLAYAYGSDDETHCRNMVAAVENLMYGIKINHYLAATMDAIPIINDSVGGVQVELLADFTSVFGPGYTEGKKVTLMGKQSLEYVQARGEMVDSTNLSRMERQRQYLNALFDKYNDTDDLDVADLYRKIKGYVTTNCTVDQLQRLLELMSSYTYEGI